MTKQAMMRQAMVDVEREDAAAGAALKAAGIKLDDESVTLEQVASALADAGLPTRSAARYHRELTARIRGVRAGTWVLQGFQEPDEDL
jgi:hypothetical protein